MTRRMTTRRNAARRPSAAVPAEVSALEQRRLLSASGNDFFRTIDGVGNNEARPGLGSAGVRLGRLVPGQYADGVHEPDDAGLPSARAVSNAVAAQDGDTPSGRYLTDLVWVWGQFLDHDLSLSGEGEESYDVPIPEGDPQFDPFGTGEETLHLKRSDTVLARNGVRQQTNLITAFIDGSVIYGSDADRAAELREFSGGRLKTSAGDNLPYNVNGYENAGGADNPSLYLAGDVRVNENVALASMHTLWVREHNRVAADLAAEHPTWSEETLYQMARRYVSAELQAITYNEFLPALLGHDAVAPYGGYDPSVNPGILNEFSTAAYRLGHSLLSPTVERVGADWQTVPEGDLALRDAFFRPDKINETGIDAILRGASVGLSQEVDAKVIDDLRNFLFGPPGAGGLDLVSLNIQRGRDHGLGSYNQTRRALGMRPAFDFGDISTDPAVQADLATAYESVEDVDLWVGLMSEDHVPNASVGETARRILSEQFTRLRDGDRYWYENTFRGRQLRELQSTTLKDVMERNTDITGLQENVFFGRGVVRHELPSHGAAMKVRVTVTESHVIVRETRSMRLMSVSDVADVDRVMIVGSGRLVDQITLDMRRATAPLEGGVSVVGGRGPNDRLTVVGGPGVDRVRMKDNILLCNGNRVEWSGIEYVSLQTMTDRDRLSIDHNVGTTVLLPGGRRHDPPGSGGGDDNKLHG